jgi:methylmalonyl-CoA/ethylmalonyl-CoA epimerase
LKVHHVGYIVNDIDSSLGDFRALGFEPVGDRCIDEQRNIRIQFLKNAEYSIELVSPLNESSPVGGILKKVGATPYHLCYETAELDQKTAELKANGFVIIAEALEAPAINEKKVVFLFKKSIGIVEIVEA